MKKTISRRMTIWAKIMIEMVLMVTLLLMAVVAVLIVLAVVVGLGHGCRGERQGGGDDGWVSCIIFACSAKFWEPQ